MPPSYRTVAERVMVRAPRTYAQVIPARYGYVNETVQVSGAQRYWTYKYDHYGRKIKCLVETPARFAQVSRRVMLRGPEVVPQYVPAAYATRQYTVQDQPGYKTWVPLGGGSRSAGYGYGASAGYGYGGGYARASYGGGYGVSSHSYGGGSGYGASYGGRGYGSSYGASYGGGYGASHGGGYGASYGGGGLIGAGLGVAGAGFGALGGGYGEY